MLWDIRACKVVYDLSTGNTNVRSLVWDETRTALYAATKCQYVDGGGNTRGYRRAEKPGYMRKFEDRRSGFFMRDNDDGDVNSDDYPPDSEDDDDESNWPKRAHHPEDYYGSFFDAAEHLLCMFPTRLLCSRSSNRSRNLQYAIPSRKLQGEISFLGQVILK